MDIATNNKIELKVWEVTKGVTFKEMFILILREVNGNRKLPMLLSASEAVGIINNFRGSMECFGIEKIEDRIPMSDTLRQMLLALDVIVEEIIISDINKGIYQTEVTLLQFGKRETVITNAADGILLAMQFRCPIYIKPEFLDRQSLEQSNNHGVSFPLNSLDLDLLHDALDGAIKMENYEMAEAIRNEINRRK